MAIAIGDVHGCLESLRALLARLPPERELVFLGDYVDRGPDSAAVLRTVERLAAERPCRLLMGNHEALMAEAIAGGDVQLWFSNGGDATLASYGEEPWQWARRPPERRALPGYERFHATLLPYYEDESAIFVHAGIDVSLPRMEDQDPAVLLWIRERFFRNAARWQGKPVIFGHTPTQSMGLGHGEVFRSHRVTGIDTGCVYGGVLSALDSVSGELWQVPGPTPGWHG
jgi:diadenosine tetraphosphatase ApaH/serine/threonine PP2A family protein phosphatase